VHKHIVLQGSDTDHPPQEEEGTSFLQGQATLPYAHSPRHTHTHAHTQDADAHGHRPWWPTAPAFSSARQTSTAFSASASAHAPADKDLEEALAEQESCAEQLEEVAGRDVGQDKGAFCVCLAYGFHCPTTALASPVSVPVSGDHVQAALCCYLPQLLWWHARCTSLISDSIGAHVLRTDCRCPLLSCWPPSDLLCVTHMFPLAKLPFRYLLLLL